MSDIQNENQHGGINLSGGNISAGRDLIGGDKIVQGDEYDVQGDINTVTIGAGAQVGQVAAGRSITQTLIMGKDEREDLAEKLEQVSRALHALQGKLDADKLELAQYKLRDLQNELTRTDGAYNRPGIERAANGLLKNAPPLGGPLGAVFQTMAAQKILAQVGASDWAAQNFG